MNKPSLTVRPDVVVELQRKEDRIETVLKAIKGDVLKEFEKVCPTDTSFQRIKKDMHDIFDEARRQLEK